MQSLLFLDETSFNLHTSANYRYSLNKDRPYYVYLANRSRNISLSIIISTTSILYYKLIDRSFISNLFVKFLEEYQENRIFRRNHISVIDNAKSYHT